MNNLVERYVHEVGRYLPQKERSEVEAELRSLIQDQLDDRYKGAPTQDDVVELLKEFGDPRRMAASYGREQYLVGPNLYPVMVWVLQRGWLLIPPIVVLVNVLVALLTGEEGTLLGLFLDTAFLVAQVIFSFTAIVVLLFAIVERTGVEIEPPAGSFNPLDLPRADDPATVDRAEAAFGIAFGIFGTLILVYFLLAGGLTLRFNLSEPGVVLPVPTGWLALFIAATTGTVLVNLVALRRGLWSVGLLLVEAGLGLLGVVCAYFVILRPLFAWLSDAAPSLANLPFMDNAAELTAVLIAFITLVDTGGKLVKVWQSRRGGSPSFDVQPNG